MTLFNRVAVSEILIRLVGSGVLFVILSLPIGVIVGTLINYLADVLPATRRLTRPACPECDQAYSLKEYLFAWRCAHCGARRSVRRAIVLVGAVTACVSLVFFPLTGLGFWASLPLLIFLGVIAVIDIEHRLVLVETFLFGLALCFIYGVVLHGFVTTLTGGLGGLLIMLTFFLLGMVFSRVVGALRGRKVGKVAFGFGDVFAGTFLGLLMGWPLIAGAVVIGMLVFAVYSLVYIAVLLATKRYSAFATALPLAPFLILGTVVVLFL
jgi:prepilin signal peptidase PulO-like enzyme (type II secretory pathway)